MSSDSAQPTLFLSYAHGDQAQAQRLAAALQRCGYTVWWDALIEGIGRAGGIAMGQQARPRPIAVSPRFSRRQLIASGAGAAVALAGGGALVAWTSGLIGSSGAAARSIAVLPFKNLIGDPRQAYLPDGLTEEVRSALARNAGLMVLAGTSSAAL